jgi:hypothetical protein
MSCIVTSVRCCNIIVLNVDVQREEKSDDAKDSIYEELQKIFGHFSKYHIRILLGDFDATLTTGDIFKTRSLA